MFEMALAAATNLRADSSVSTAGLAAASIAAPCLLGSMAAEQQASSSPEVLLCAVGLTSSHTGIQLSSELAGVHPNQSHTHLSASAATVQNHSAPAKAFIGRGALQLVLAAAHRKYSLSPSEQMWPRSNKWQGTGITFILQPWTAHCILVLWQVRNTTLPAVCQWGSAPTVLRSQVNNPHRV